jgi:DNA replication protein DnaC
MTTDRDKLQAFYAAMRDADIPVRHASFKASESTNAEWTAKLAALKALVGTGCIVALCGNRGGGKTQLAVELIRRSCYTGGTALYRCLMEFFVDLKSSYNGGEETEAQVLARYALPGLLVLDEAHERGGTTWESSMLNLLIDKRYRARKDTITVANLTIEELPTALGPSIMRRLDDTGGIVECAWGRMGQGNQAKGAGE